MRQRWLDFTLQRAWVVIGLLLVMIIAAAAGGKNLYFRGDYKVFFDSNNPELMAFEQMQRVFNKNENAAIVIAPKKGDVFNLTTLTLIKELTDEAWQTPFSSRVDSVSNFQYTWAEEDDLIVEDLILDVADIDQARIEKIREVSLAEPNLVGRLVGEQGKAAIVNVTVQLPDGDVTKEVFTIVDHIKALTAQYQAKYPEHDFYHTGVVLMNHSFASEAQNDSQTLIPLMFVVIILVMWFLLRSFSGTMATLIVIVTTIAATMGLSGWMGMFLSTATVNVPTMVMTLAVADCIHVISSMLYALRQGKSKVEAIRYSMELNLVPIFITSATTSIGFLTLNFAAVPVLADLGNLTAIGVMLACGLSLTLLPAMLYLLPMREAKEINATRGRMEAFGEWVIVNHKRLFPISLLVIVSITYFATNNRLNDVATEYFDQSTQFRQSIEYQQQSISGMTTIDFAVYTNKDSGINDPEVLSVLGDFSDWLEQQPEVDHVNSIVDTFKRLNKNMHGDDQDYYRLPDDQELAAQYLLLYEMSLPYGLDLNNQLDIEKSATRIQVTFKNLGSQELTDIENRVKAWFTDNGPGLEVAAASPALMFAHIGEANMSSLLKGTLLALLLISGLLVFALRSWRLGLISLIPNILPAGVGFGIWGLYSADINMGLSVVLSMTLGIIVDDTVHFLTKYQHARVLGKHAQDAVRYAFASVGRALWITTLVLTMGFSMLTLSSFALNSDMGLLTSIIIVSALAVDFLFLPAFLMFFDKKEYTPEDANEDPLPQA